MPTHYWGDEDFDWNGLNEAINLVHDICRRYGRIGMHPKEKYGTFRDQLWPFNGSLYSIVKPGYVYHRWPRWLHRLDDCVIAPTMRLTGIARAISWWQRQVYNYAIQKACKRYPHIVDEIVSDLDGYEWVRPGLFGPIDGTAIHNKYWVKVDL